MSTTLPISQQPSHLLILSLSIIWRSVFHVYLRSAVVLLNERGHGSGYYDVARSVGGAAGGL